MKDDKYYLESNDLFIKLTPEIVGELRKEIKGLKCVECGGNLGIGCVDNICYILCRNHSEKHMCGYEIKKDVKLEKKPYVYKLDLRIKEMKRKISIYLSGSAVDEEVREY